MNRICFLLAALVFTLQSFSQSQCVNSRFYWSSQPTVNNPSGGPYTATGTINGIGYTYTSSSPVNLDGAYGIVGGGTFPPTYNLPITVPSIRNDFATTNTLTFASPVTNPVLVFASIGSASLSVPIQFSDPVQIEWSKNVTLDNPTQITGTEGYAIVRIMGTFSSISFKYMVAETWCDFLFGADFQGCCCTTAYPVVKNVTGAPAATSLTDKPLQGSSSETSGVQQDWTYGATITSLPTNGFVLTYNGHVITQADITAGGYYIPSYDLTKLSIAPGVSTPGSAKTTAFSYTVNGTNAGSSAPVSYTVNFTAALPVTFGTVSASFKNGSLVVNWATETEVNNDHFEIEASADGVHFATIGTVSTLAPDGQSKTTLHYQFRKEAPGGINLALGIGLLALGGIGTLVNRKRRAAFLSIALLGGTIFYAGCAKTATPAPATGNLYIRVVQIDKDDHKSNSAVVKVVQE